MSTRRAAGRADVTSIDNENLSPQANELLRFDRADRTVTEYVRAFRRYSAWRLEFDGGDAMDGSPHALVEYINHFVTRGYAFTTIAVAVASVRFQLAHAGRPMEDRDGMVDLALKAAVRKLTKRKPRAARPMTLDTLASVVPPVDERLTNQARRDAAIVLIGYFGAMRRSEIAALTIGDVKLESGAGLHVHISKAKSDQLADGREISLSARPETPDTCPVLAFEAWMEVRSTARDYNVNPRWRNSLPLFCKVGATDAVAAGGISEKTVERTLKRMLASAGLENSGITPHSLRAGLLTEASSVASLAEMMQHARHSNPRSTMVYVRPDAGWDTNVTRKLARRTREPD